MPLESQQRTDAIDRDFIAVRSHGLTTPTSVVSHE